MTQSYALREPRKHFTSLIAVFTLVAMLAGIAPRPARADSATTTAVLLGAAAVAAGIIISNNVRHKQMQANTPVGRTQDGGIIYGDGHVAYPNGDVLYTGNGNGQRCSFNGYGTPCEDEPVVYYPRNYNGHNHGNHYGQYKHRQNRHRDENDSRDGGYYHGNGRSDRGEHGDHGDGEN